MVIASHAPPPTLSPPQTFLFFSLLKTTSSRKRDKPWGKGELSRSFAGQVEWGGDD